MDAAIHMSFGSKIKYCTESHFKYFVNRHLIGDVSLDEMIPGIVREIRKALRVPCVCKLVEVEEFNILARA